MSSTPTHFKRTMFFLVLCAGLAASGCARTTPHPSISGPGPLAPPQAAAGFYHTIERGQTLYRIAKMYSVDVHDLMRINHIASPSRLEIGQRLFIPAPQQPSAITPTLLPSPAYQPMSLEEVKGLISTPGRTYAWRTITLHHSGTLRGSALHFHRDHLRRGMGGLFYHFVIGNGSYTPDGAIEVGWRWKKQVKANRPFDVQICVVGDFNRQQMTEAQFNSVCRLVEVLQQEFGISADLIRRHEDIPGKHTECPGRNFPFHRILERVSEDRR